MTDLIKKTQLIGILNCTPDSYFDKGRFTTTNDAITYGLNLFNEGADIVDIGGESTQPHSHPVSVKEELSRIIPVIAGIREKTHLPISVDTFKPPVAELALKAGANILNDITGGQDPQMGMLAAKTGALIILMHIKGPPHTQPVPNYPKGVLGEICTFFKKRIRMLQQAGVKDSQIILDPGIGGGSFGKTPEQNLLILKNLKTFKALGYPILISLSRKSFLQKILKKEASELLSTTLALNTMAALESVDYIRVHDVLPHRYILTLLEYMKSIK
ncbi:MAG: dihydropteroate synthase [Chlamydiales bacterium]